MNFGFSGEMIFIFFLALILFGPKKLPEIARTIGRFMNEFRRASNEFRSQIESEINVLEQSKPQILPPIKEPLGSLASRIFNPPSTEQPRAPETKTDNPLPVSKATETYPANGAPAGNLAADEKNLAPSPAPSSEEPVASVAALHPKVAPDA